ncbi:hypothetical protein JB92DRAFT_3133744 [Gautieria morchelliformis]|nr:hypothetical protein JB92DRAFT_3133744 [Gautieria morchelliformis]
MPLPHISDSDSSKEEVIEVAGPITSVRGRMIKPSAALEDPSNVARVLGQPQHYVSAPVDTAAPPPKKKQRQSKGKSTGKGKETQTAQNTDASDPLAILLNEPADPDGWLKDLDGVEDMPEVASKKADRTQDIGTFFDNVPDVGGKKMAECKLCHKNGQQKTHFVHEDINAVAPHACHAHRRLTI